jgi:hypothetical protein
LVWNVISYFKGAVNITRFAQQSDRENKWVVHFEVWRCPVAECYHGPQSN